MRPPRGCGVIALATGKLVRGVDLLAAVWASPMVIAGKVYLGDEGGDVVILQGSPVKKLIGEMNMGSAVFSTVVPAHETLFIAGRSRLWALAEKR